MSISERIKALVEYEGSQTKLAKIAGLHNAAISRIINATSTTLRSDTLEAILKAYPNLNCRWLLTGLGEMWLDRKSPSPSKKHRSQPDKPEKDYLNQLKMLQRFNQLQEHRLAELEREIREHAPKLAKRLGL
jgi:transcriptional regulator with XRE-family HTH domain